MNKILLIICLVIFNSSCSEGNKNELHARLRAVWNEMDKQQKLLGKDLTQADVLEIKNEIFFKDLLFPKNTGQASSSPSTWDYVFYGYKKDFTSNEVVLISKISSSKKYNSNIVYVLFRPGHRLFFELDKFPFSNENEIKKFLIKNKIDSHKKWNEITTKKGKN
jgi:hypothetical protein